MSVTTLALASTGLLTLLLVVGLVFFVRAAVKDRTQTQTFSPPDPAAARQQVERYLQKRGYRLVAGETGDKEQCWQGYVRPSGFLALLLSLLVGLSGWCLGLVLISVQPAWGGKPLGLVALGPLAGVFYWRGASRCQTVTVHCQENGFRITAPQPELERLQRWLSTAPRDPSPSPAAPTPPDRPPTERP